MAAGADLVLLNGVVSTMDPRRPRAEAVAIAAGRLVAVGSNADARSFVGPRTRVIDLGGRGATPGLVDGHCHLYGLGSWAEMLSLRDVESEERAASLVGERAARSRPGDVIHGRGWDQNRWDPPRFPDKRALDRVAPASAVVLRRVDGHVLWLNSAALARAAITRETPDPPGGTIGRDDRREPTGILVDAAMDLVEASLPCDTQADCERKLLAAQTEALAAGVTSVHEMGVDDVTLAAYERLAAEGLLKLRVYVFLSAGALANLDQRRQRIDEDGTASLVVRGVKLYADGALGSHGAAMLEPYRDDPETSGLVLTGDAELRSAASLAARSGWQLAVHAIGDRANRMVLDAYAAAGVRGRDLRFRVEHAQLLSLEDVPRFADLGVVASMQPKHATSDMRWATSYVGAERLAGAYAWRTVLSSGAHLVGGSDFPVEEVSPLLGIHAAVTRQDARGEPPGGWLPDERLSLDDAIRIFTVEPAWAAFAESHRGRLAPGFVADLTIFDRPLTADAMLLATKVDMTIVGGAIVYERVGS